MDTLRQAGLLQTVQGRANERPLYLWPENVRAWHCWLDLQTQWRVGVSGITGLDYPGVRAYLDEEGLQPDERADVWRGVRAAERAVLEVASRQAAERR